MEKTKLILKKVKGNISASEEQELQEWLAQSNENKAFYDHILFLIKGGEDIRHLLDVDAEKVWKELNIKRSFQKPQKKTTFKKYLKYAAVFIGLLICLGGGFMLVNKNLEEGTPQLVIEDEVITLTMDSGIVKTINEEGVEELTNKDGEVIGQKQGTKLQYNSAKKVETLVYNTLNVPYGKRAEIELSDGSYVYLNAGSSLKFPVKFLDEKERRVFVTGETYFEVAKDAKHPFIIEKDNLQIEVLGTEFNVSAYSEDYDIDVVLVEGKVALYDKEQADKQETLLAPGEKASWNKKDNSATISKVDTDLYTGWREGRLLLRDTPFRIIRKRIERKYNVVIENNNKTLDEQRYNIHLKDESIEEVLSSLKETFHIDYKIINNIIIIN